MDNFNFNFDSDPPPPPTQLQGVIFSFVPTPVSELNRLEQDYEKYLQEWDNIKKLSPAQQDDLLQRSRVFINNVRPGQIAIDKFGDKMDVLYENLDDEVKYAAFF